MRKHSVKNERINAEVQRELSNIIRNEVKDPRIPLLISVVEVEVAPDLKTCKAYLSVLGDEKVVADTKAALKSAGGFIRSRLAKNLNLRLTPEISYYMDQSIEYGVNMSSRIDQVMKEQNEKAALRDEAEEAAEEQNAAQSD